jgi:hypothetical protein
MNDVAKTSVNHFDRQKMADLSDSIVVFSLTESSHEHSTYGFIQSLVYLPVQAIMRTNAIGTAEIKLPVYCIHTYVHSHTAIKNAHDNSTNSSKMHVVCYTQDTASRAHNK